MDKTININLGGTLFSIDEDGYPVLRDYLDAIDRKFKNVQGGNETIEDIEFRIAELFRSQTGNAGIISKENVESVISIIGRPEDFDQPQTESMAYERASSKKRKMFRNPDDTIVGGVCGGIGTYLDTDPVWIRILFVIFTFFFGLGFFIYLALWLALPSAKTENQRKEMYGSNSFYSGSSENRESPYHTTSKVGNAFNAIFRALGKVFFVLARILLIIFGTCLVLAGFLTIFAFIMVFIFKYPGAFSTDVAGINLSYIPDFLNYIVSPNLVPYIKALITAVVTIPFLVLIYGGIRMIFWFRARDGVVWLIGLILWVLSAAALAILLFSEGVSFAQTAKSTSQSYFKANPDTLYIVSGRKISDLNTDKEIIVPDEFYSVYISDEKKELYTKVSLDIDAGNERKTSVEIIKCSSGRNIVNAIERSERLRYNYTISNDTLYIDEYFTIPADTRWSFDNVFIKVHAPEGTIIYMDKTTESQFHSVDDDDFIKDFYSRFWKLEEDGLNYIEPKGKVNR